MATDHIDTIRIPADLRPALSAIANASAELSQAIRRGTPPDQPETLFLDALRHAGMRWVALAGDRQPVGLGGQGDLALALDPLNCPRDIQTNHSVGTVFSIFRAAQTANESFLRRADQQIAAGYVLHGPRCQMVVTFGDGVQLYALDPDSGRFDLHDARVAMPDCSFDFAINASNYRHWPRAIRAYIDDCLAGVDGPRGTNFDMRWMDSLLADTHRILMRGGIFLSPADGRRGYEHGHMRLLHECAPIAFLIEQAGGRATDGTERILDRRIDDFDQRAALIFGSGEKVARVAAYHDLPEREVSALFGHRGLFRA